MHWTQLDDQMVDKGIKQGSHIRPSLLLLIDVRFISLVKFGVNPMPFFLGVFLI